MAGMDVKWGGTTLAPPKAAVVETTSVEIERRDPKAEVATAAFLGLGKGIPMTPKALGGRGKTTLYVAS